VTRAARPRPATSISASRRYAQWNAHAGYRDHGPGNQRHRCVARERWGHHRQRSPTAPVTRSHTSRRRLEPTVRPAPATRAWSTAADGTFTITNLPSGSTRCASNSTTNTDRWHLDDRLRSRVLQRCRPRRHSDSDRRSRPAPRGGGERLAGHCRAISGKVTDSAGHPVAEVEVRVGERRLSRFDRDGWHVHDPQPACRHRLPSLLRPVDRTEQLPAAVLQTMSRTAGHLPGRGHRPALTSGINAKLGAAGSSAARSLTRPGHGLGDAVVSVFTAGGDGCADVHERRRHLPRRRSEGGT